MASTLMQRRATADYDKPSTPRKAEAGLPPPPSPSPAAAAAAAPSEPQLPLSCRLPVAVFALAYLLTGTSLAVMGQIVTDQGAFHPSTQLVAWTKYAVTLALTLALQLGARVWGAVGLRAGRAAGGKATGRGGDSSCSDPNARSSSSSSSSGSSSSGSSSNSRKAAWLTLAVGLLDTLSYGLNCLGFALCGSALSMVVFAACGQLFTALTRRLLLGRGMTAGQTAGVCLVAVGLAVRSAGHLPAWGPSLARWPPFFQTTAASSLAAAAATTTPAPAALLTSDASNDSSIPFSAASAALSAASAASAAAAPAATAAPAPAELLLGVALVALSAAGYSLLGCLYEWLSELRGPDMSHAKVATRTSLLGLAATSAYQLAVTRPRWGELVAGRMAARGLTWGRVLPLYGSFGALFTVHGLVQGVVLQRAGATAVGVVGALRAAAVAAVSGVLFCGPAAPQQCLTPAAAASAAVVTAGALTWTLAGPRKPAAAATVASSSPAAASDKRDPQARTLSDAAPGSHGKHGKLS